MKICIDPGHRNTTYDFGAVSGGAKESEIALKIALLVGEGFRQAGHEVHYTRKSETDVISLEQRIKNANAIKNLDYYLSIHINSFSNETANGFEVWHYGGLKDLSTSICDNVCKVTGLTNRGAKASTQYFVLKNTYCNALIIENGFISNEKDRSQLLLPHFQLKLANAILAAFNIKPIADKEESKQEDALMNTSKQNIMLNGVLKEVDYILKDNFTYIKLRDLADSKIEINYDALNKIPVVKVK